MRKLPTNSIAHVTAVDVYSVVRSSRPQCVLSGRFIGLHHPVSEPVHLCVTLWSLQTPDKRDAGQELRYSQQRRLNHRQDASS